MAVRAAPEFAAAHNNLAVQYVYLGRFADAVDQFDVAARISPRAHIFANLAVALSKLGRPTEAEQTARRAVALESGYAKGHLALGSILARKPGSRAEAMRELSLAAPEEPSAYALLARLQTEAANQRPKP